MSDHALPVFDLTYLSLGAGVQSSALLVCSALGLHGVPRADVAIFADTMQEPRHVYEAVERLREWAAPHGIPIETVSAGDLLQNSIDRCAGTRARCASIPMFVRTAVPLVQHSDNQVTQNGAVLGLGWYTVHVCDSRCVVVGHKIGSAPKSRHCTRDHKIVPIERRVRELLGYSSRQRVRKHARALVGISVDEIGRVKPSRTPWITRAHPLVDARLTREACIRIVEEAGLPRPSKSACVFCPYTDDARWIEMRDTDPESFARACAADEALRDQSKTGLRRRAFVHRSLVPLRDVRFKVEEDNGLFGDGFGAECEGMCGI